MVSSTTSVFTNEEMAWLTWRFTLRRTKPLHLTGYTEDDGIQIGGGI